jgi:hypothetical protein
MANPVIIKDQLERAIYMSPPLDQPVPVFFFKNKVWMTQIDIANLYGVQRLSIKKHLRNAYKKEKLVESEIIANSKNTETDEEFSGTKYYNLTAILNIGHRINSAYPLKLEAWIKERELQKKNKVSK